jgi:hypothetical protein
MLANGGIIGNIKEQKRKSEKKGIVEPKKSINRAMGEI